MKSTPLDSSLGKNTDEVTNPGEEAINFAKELEKANLKKAHAEIEKLEAEKRKVIAEEQQVLKNIKKSFIQKKDIYQAILVAFLTIPVAWFYYTEIALPLSQAENIQLKRDNEMAKDSLIAEREELKILQLNLESARKNLLAAKDTFQIRDSLSKIYLKQLEQNRTLTHSERKKNAQILNLVKSKDNFIDSILTSINNQDTKNASVQKQKMIPISGIVRRRTDNVPIENAQVYLEDSHGKIYRAVSDTRGEYKIEISTEYIGTIVYISVEQDGDLTSLTKFKLRAFDNFGFDIYLQSR